MESIAEEAKPMTSNQKYRMANREKINEQRKKYYQARKEADPKFLEYKRMKSKEYYERKKAKKVEVVPPEKHVEMGDNSDSDLSQSSVESKPEVIDEPVCESLKLPDVIPDVIPDVKESKKRKAKKAKM
jgi:hypothetical protein